MSESAKPTLSVVVPALNEEAHIADAVEEIERAVDGRFSDYEILLFNDGSIDGTGAIMDRIARENPRVRVTHNSESRNLGGVYKQGVAMARHEYIVMIPGDNENPASAMQAPFDALGRADIVLPYPTNTEVRTRSRAAISRAYVMGMNLLFGLKVRYYNGTVIHRTENVRSIEIVTDSFAYQSEALIKLLRADKSFVEVGIEIAPPHGRESKILRWKNIVGVLKAVTGLLIEIYWRPLFMQSSVRRAS